MALSGYRFVAILLLGLAVAGACRADVAAVPEEGGPAPGLSDAIANGRLLLELRPRYNVISESAKPEKTQAWTYRALAGWQTAPFYDLRLTAQAIHTDIIGARRLNDDPAQFFASEYPLLPDPPVSGINQLFVDYSGLESTRIRVGRQILRVDNQRFISDVDFRQTPQVFDGATVTNRDLPNTEILLGEYRRMRSVLGKDSRLRLSILHAAWNPAPDHSLAAYGYWHDTPAASAQTGLANSAHRSIGVRAEGNVRAGETVRLLYHAEYAKQAPVAGGDARIDAGYTRLGGGVSIGGWGARLDREVKGSNRGLYGFQTPLGDFYAFNGFALQFTSTPPQGLRDSWLTLRGAPGGVECFGEYHRYRTDVGGLDLGHEWDATVAYSLLNNLQAKLQLARYRSGSGTRSRNDVDKTWLALIYTY